MTGPGPGKIPLDAKVYLTSTFRRLRVNCKVYLHLKGYSRARVTHLDIECPEVNNVFPPGTNAYGFLKVKGNYIEIIPFKRLIEKKNGIIVRKLIVESVELAEKIGYNTKSVVYIGGKVGGIFIGFKKEILEKLQDFYSRTYES